MKNSTEQNTRGIGKGSNAHDQLKAKEEEKSNLSAGDRCEIPLLPLLKGSDEMKPSRLGEAAKEEMNERASERTNLAKRKAPT